MFMLRKIKAHILVYQFPALYITLAVSLSACSSLSWPANLSGQAKSPSIQEEPLPRTTPLIRSIVTPQENSVTSTPITAELAQPTADQPAPGRSTPVASPTPAWQPQEPYRGIWISRDELANLPTDGPAWEQLKTAADRDPGTPLLREKDQINNVYVLAKALVFARTGEPGYRKDVIDNLMAAIGTEEGGRTLALGREVLAYVIAADLVNLPAEEDEDRRFRSWLRQVLTEPLDGSTLISTHETRPNNWGTHAGASRVGVALYLGDNEELERAAKVFKGWLGDRDAYTGFDYGKLYWQADPDNPVGINSTGTTKEGFSIDGALPEEMRRGGKFHWPPRETGYAWEAMQGALVEAELLYRAGYDAWQWEDKALLRAAKFLNMIDWQPEGDDEWLPWLINHAYGTDFPAKTPARPGKNMGWTDWTHSQDQANVSAIFENGEDSNTAIMILGTEEEMIAESR